MERTITFRNSKFSWTGVPIIASNMDTVGTFEMAVTLAKVSRSLGEVDLRYGQLFWIYTVLQLFHIVVIKLLLFVIEL